MVWRGIIVRATETLTPLTTTPAFALQARYVFPVSGPPLANGVLTIAGERIVAVGQNVASQAPVDLGNVAILPGLANAHTHLEFSHLDRPLGRPGMALPDWIREVIAWRRSAVDQRRRPIEHGLAESIACGTTALGEIRTTQGLADDEQPPLALSEFAEVICLAEDRFEATLDRLRDDLQTPHGPRRWRRGISPHAPYTVHPELFARLVQLAVDRHVPLAFHVAESPQELQLLTTARGPFRDLLESLGVWNPAAFAAPRRPLDYLQRLAQAQRALVVHGNYLDDEEIAFVAEHRDRLSVVYCPRTHAFFGHRRHPLAKLLDAGAAVAIGTDSRASNPDLSLLAELRFVAAKFAEIAPGKVLELGTLGGARALGSADESGSLERSKFADLAVVALPDGRDSDPHRLLFDSSLPVVGTMFRGHWVWLDRQHRLKFAVGPKHR